MNKKLGLIMSAILILMLLTACGNADDNQEHVESGNETKDTEKTEGEVIVTLVNQEGDNVGSALLKQVEEGVQITLDATHLPPGKHGFHIHETAACEGPDFESAGGHFNPTDAEHGFDNPNGPHAGDLPNIDVGDDGTIQEEVIADMATLEKDQENSLLDEDGTSLMIHSDADDNVSDPAGDAGDRIACGMIIEE